MVAQGCRRCVWQQALLLLVAGLAWGLDGSPSMPGLLRVEEPPPEGAVDVVRYRAGFDQARTEEDLKQLFRDNLDADMAPFRRKDWTIQQFAEFVLRFNATVPRHELGEGNAALVIVRNGTVKVQWLRGKDNHWRMACITAAINGAKSLRFPDSAFIVNIDDFPVCAGDRCPLPVFTMYKKWRGGNVETNEVLMPVFNHHYEDLYFFPWDRKRPKAFMRASQQGCMEPNSTRTVLAVLSEDHPDRLDLGITRIDGAQKHDLKYRFSKAGFISIEDHAKWKYQVSADGCVAQTRLAKVMLTNSVVLKEESAWIEYYYRSLRPWKHYVPLPQGEASGRVILGLVDQLRREDKRAQGIAEDAQKWAYRFLPNYPRLLYFRKTLVEYNALFGGQMERWVRDFGPEALFPSDEALAAPARPAAAASGGAADKKPAAAAAAGPAAASAPAGVAGAGPAAAAGGVAGGVAGSGGGLVGSGGGGGGGGVAGMGGALDPLSSGGGGASADIAALSAVSEALLSEAEREKLRMLQRRQRRRRRRQMQRAVVEGLGPAFGGPGAEGPAAAAAAGGGAGRWLRRLRRGGGGGGGGGAGAMP